MKRVKIMLSAILVMAVVAGAFAFKAKKGNQVCYWSITRNQPETTTTCPLIGTTLIEGLITTNNPAVTQFYATSTLVNGTCTAYQTQTSCTKATLEFE